MYVNKECKSMRSDKSYIVCLEFYSDVYFYWLTILNKSVEKIIFNIISKHTSLTSCEF